jgi:hypothetical protein
MILLALDSLMSAILLNLRPLTSCSIRIAEERPQLLSVFYTVNTSPSGIPVQCNELAAGLHFVSVVYPHVIPGGQGAFLLARPQGTSER